LTSSAITDIVSEKSPAMKRHIILVKDSGISGCPKFLEKVKSMIKPAQKLRHIYLPTTQHNGPLRELCRQIPGHGIKATCFFSSWQNVADYIEKKPLRKTVLVIYGSHSDIEHLHEELVLSKHSFKGNPNGPDYCEKYKALKKPCGHGYQSGKSSLRRPVLTGPW
jgi:hypothetical protein